MTLALLGNFKRKRYEVLMRLNKNNPRLLTGFLTGHCKLGKHLKILGVD